MLQDHILVSSHTRWNLESYGTQPTHSPWYINNSVAGFSSVTKNSTAEDKNYGRHGTSWLVLESPVTRTGQNWWPNRTRTDENWTVGPVLDFFLPVQSPVLSFFKNSRTGQRLVQTGSGPVFQSSQITNIYSGSQNHPNVLLFWTEGLGVEWWHNPGSWNLCTTNYTIFTL